MKLALLHGRHDPTEEMQEIGFVGPVLEDVLYLHATYQATFDVGFLNEAAAQHAAELTGWHKWDGDSVVTMEFFEDMALVTDKSGKKTYYGDWELMLWAPSDKP